MKLTRTLTTVSRSTIFIAAWMMMAAAASHSQQPSQKKIPVRAAAPAATSAPEPKYKGIWEPVNYKEDLRLDDVFFVTPEEGWVSGAAGTILHTTDGGQTWTAQLGGDPQSPEIAISMLRFLDQKHGWAVQGSKMLVTSDGENWEQIGELPAGLGLLDYVFLSSGEGLLLDGNNNAAHILQTRDRGRTWKDTLPVTACHAKIQVQGLSRDATCVLRALHFSSPKIGYAVGGTWNDFNTLFVAKTEDGGSTWSLSNLPDIGSVWLGGAFTSSHSLFFTDEKTGFLSLNDAKLLATSDGGQSWHGLVASPAPNLRFADPEVGWGFGGSRLTYTTDGGKHWTSRQFSFPAGTRGFSLPRRDRGYIVGDHGMVYRYRVVPLDYTTKGMIDAPLMPAYGEPLLGHLQQMKTQVAALQKKLATAGTGASSSSQLPPALYGGGLDFEDSTDFEAETPQAGQAAPAAGGFVQDTSDVPPSPFVQNCCAPQVQSMQTSFGSFSQAVPSFGTRFRSLNLILAGLNLVSDLLGKTKQIGDSFVAFKRATDAQTAGAALQGLSATLDNTHQAMSMGFSNFSAASLAAGAAGTLQNAATDALNPNAASTTQPGAQDADKAKQDAKKAAEELKKKLRKKLPF